MDLPGNESGLPRRQIVDKHLSRGTTSGTHFLLRTGEEVFSIFGIECRNTSNIYIYIYIYIYICEVAYIRSLALVGIA